MSPGKQPDEDDPAAVRGQLEGAGHRSGVAGGVDDHGRQVAAAKLQELLASGRAGRQGVPHPELPAAKLQARGADVHHRQLHPGHLRELDHAQADRAGPDDQDRVGGLQLGPLDGVGADAEGLHQGQLVVGQPGRRVQLARRHAEDRAHAAVDVHAQHLELRAAVGLAAAAGDAAAAIQVRLDRAAVAAPQRRPAASPGSSTSTPSSWPRIRG